VHRVNTDTPAPISVGCDRRFIVSPGRHDDAGRYDVVATFTVRFRVESKFRAGREPDPFCNDASPQPARFADNRIRQDNRLLDVAPGADADVVAQNGANQADAADYGSG
jgi:hypothetical protein